MSEETKAIRGRLEAATPGPWSAGIGADDDSIVGPGFEEIVGGRDHFFWSQGDYMLLLHSRDDLAFLLAENERQAGEIERLRAAMEPGEQVRELVRRADAAMEACPHTGEWTRRFNNGNGAWTCNSCGKIVAYGHEDPRAVPR
jgi:hypothetical protein